MGGKGGERRGEERRGEERRGEERRGEERRGEPVRRKREGGREGGRKGGREGGREGGYIYPSDSTDISPAFSRSHTPYAALGSRS
jgi:hypothetical protein